MSEAMFFYPNRADSGTFTGLAFASRTNGFTGGINDIAYGENIFVAVGDSGELYTSADGITWTSRTSQFSSDDILGVGYGDGIFVAVGGTGKISHSVDGVTWVAAATPSFGTTTINDVAYDATLDLWVAVAESGKLATSPDGDTWTQRTSSFSTTGINGVAANGSGTFVAVGDSGKIASSTDGTTWTQRTSAGFSTDNILCAAFGNALFAIAGVNGKLETSPAGTTWTARTSGFSTTTINGLTFALGWFWAVGASGTATRSHDGVTFTAFTSGFSSTTINDAVAGIGIVALVGESTTITTTTGNGGLWTGGLPETDLADRRLSKPARSADATVLSTKFENDLGADYHVKGFGLFKHNVSLAGNVRLRGWTAYTHNRADTATYDDEDGVVQAAANNVLRQWHYLTTDDAVFRRATLLERAYTNLITTDDYTAWSAENTPVVTSGQSDPAGGTAAYLIEDDDAVNWERITFAPTFTGDGTKCWSAELKAGTSGQTDINLEDTTASLTRANMRIIWGAGGVPTFTAPTGTALGYQTLTDGWYRFYIQTPNTIVAANANKIKIYPAGATGAATGTVYVHKLNLYDQVIPAASELSASEATTQDDFSVSLLDATPQEGTYLAELAVLDLPNQGTTRVFCNLGNGNGSNAAVRLYFDASTSRLYIAYHNGTSEVTGYWTVSLSLYDYITVRWYQESGGDISSVGLAINGAAEDTTLDGAFGSVLALPSAWANDVVQFSGSNATANQGLISFKAQSGSEKTLAQMTALKTCDIALYSAYDSQWQAVYPTIYPATSELWGEDVSASALSAENFAAGYTCDYVLMVPSVEGTTAGGVGMRYVGCELDDTANVDGYVEIGRFWAANGYQPGINFRAGAEFGWLDRLSKRLRSRGGGSYYDARPTERSFVPTFENVDADEALVQLQEMMRRWGTTEQFMFVYDPTDTIHMHRRAFPAVLERVSRLKIPNALFFTQPFQVSEDI